MANQTEGLRAWSAKAERRMMAHSQFQHNHGPPTALGVDALEDDSGNTRIMCGFEDGSFSLHSLESSGHFVLEYSHPPSSNGVISAVALNYPYAVTLTATQLLSVYHFGSSSETEAVATSIGVPRLLHSLKSPTVWPPLSVSLRTGEQNVVVSIAYTLTTYLSGWTVGVQEIRLDRSGKFFF